MFLYDFVNTLSSSYVVAGFDTAADMTPGLVVEDANIPWVCRMSVETCTESGRWSVSSSVSSILESGTTPMSYVSVNSVGIRSNMLNPSEN